MPGIPLIAGDSKNNVKEPEGLPESCVWGSDSLLINPFTQRKQKIAIIVDFFDNVMALDDSKKIMLYLATKHIFVYFMAESQKCSVSKFRLKT